jgi:hypothetical protein
LEHARGEQITRFDAFLLKFRKRHRPPILMHASADNLAQLYDDVLQSFPLSGRQTHYPNLHVEFKLPGSLLALAQFSPPSSENAMPIANRKVRSPYTECAFAIDSSAK